MASDVCMLGILQRRFLRPEWTCHKGYKPNPPQKDPVSHVALACPPALQLVQVLFFLHSLAGGFVQVGGLE